MLFWLFVIILVVGVITIVLGSWLDSHSHYYDFEWLKCIGWAIIVLMSLCILISGIIMIDGYAAVDAKVAQNQEIYNSLTYQLENNLYDNDNDFGKKELYNEIQNWNKDVVYYQNIQDNFWLGIYYPNVFDQFKTIEYKAYE